MSAAAEIGASALARLVERAGREGDPARRADLVVAGLADAIKATSNDQNAQRLARELRSIAPELVACLTAKAVRDV